MKKVYYSNDDISDMLKEVVRQISYSEVRPDVIVGLSRGGLDIGVKLSHYFEVPFEPLKWQTRNGDFQDYDNLRRVMSEYQRVLVIDDILDSGRSIKDIVEFVDTMGADAGKLYTATLIENLAVSNINFPDFSAVEIDKSVDDAWIVFPWENWWAPSLR